MFEKFSVVAEQAAISASRRQFLGRLGRGAMLAAATIGGLLAMSSSAEAGRRCSIDADCPPGHICDAGRCRKCRRGREC